MDKQLNEVISQIGKTKGFHSRFQTVSNKLTVPAIHPLDKSSQE